MDYVMCEIHSQIIHRVAGELSCEYEAEVPSWSRVDFGVSFTVSSGDLCGNVLVKSPSPWDSDDRGIFCLYLFPGTTKHTKVCLHYNYYESSA
jgi:hypothetical protein